MKFWQKSFFCVIAVFLVGFDVMGYMLAERSYALNKDYAVASAETEQEVIKKSLSDSISLSKKNFTELNPANLAVTIEPYANFYISQGIYFQLYQDEILVFNNLPDSEYREYSGNGEYDENGEDNEKLSPGETLLEIKEIDSGLYCIIASYLAEPSSELRFVYIKDMRPLAHFKESIINTFTTISIIVSLVLSVVMLFLLINLTRPFRRLNAVAAEISEGLYHKRVAVTSRDEIGDFAKSFNLMANHIEEHIAMLSDMTESRQRFIDSLAHELRTPVTAIVGYGELLKYANCGDEEKEAAINYIISQSLRIKNMSVKLLDLAYMSNENIEMLPVKLGDIMADVKASLGPVLKDKSIELREELAQLSINGDSELLKSLLINLIDNAVKASEYGGIIEIHAYEKSANNPAYSADNPSVQLIEIIDHGTGMETPEISKITEPFYRVDKSRSGGGAGLGLALCARICELHKATLDISSELQKGTIVKILFTTL